MTVKSLAFFFFFSSGRRHTRYWRDWSSDVCSSDLSAMLASFGGTGLLALPRAERPAATADLVEGSEERRVGKSVDLGGRRIIKKKKKKKKKKEKKQTTKKKKNQRKQRK